VRVKNNFAIFSAETGKWTGFEYYWLGFNKKIIAIITIDTAILLFVGP
jgi:hypothetical protein